MVTFPCVACSNPIKTYPLTASINVFFAGGGQCVVVRHFHEACWVWFPTQQDREDFILATWVLELRAKNEEART